VDLIRSEEELRRSSAWRPVERLRVRKRVVSEERTVTVTLRREELVVERSPVADGVAVPGEPPVPEPLVLTLSEEQAVITTRVVPVERVRVVVDRIPEDHELSTTLRAERVEVTAEPPSPA
jgi:uncharacterized protein (TIGR02271 family)